MSRDVVPPAVTASTGGTSFQRGTLWLMIPMSLVLCVWLWIGRVLFGVGGWFILILLPVALLALVALLVTAALGLTQVSRPRRLTTPQAIAQWTVWAGLFGAGLVMPDFGDAPDSEISALTQVFGRSDSLLEASYLLAGLGLLVALAAWVVLLALLVLRRPRTASGDVTDPEGPGPAAAR